MRLDWRWEIPQIALILGMFLASALVWNLVPDRVSVHWNLAGEVDRYGGKVEGLLLVPVLALALYVLFIFLPRLDPRRAAYAGFAGSYALIRFAIIAFLAAMHGALLLTATGHPTDIGRVVPILMGILFVILGIAMGRVQRNWFVGVRTPWTLSSPSTWEKTHRVAAWVFGAAGVLFVLTGLFGTPALLLVDLVALLGATLGIVVYSYLVWRVAPDRTA